MKTFPLSLFAFVFIAYLVSLPAEGNLEPSDLAIANVARQLNSTSWAAANLLDVNNASQWLSGVQSNDINFTLSGGPSSFCVSGTEVINYGNNDRSVERFMILTSERVDLANDTGTVGWRPITANASPNYALNYMLWAQGARLQSTDSQLNSSTWATTNMIDGDYGSRWLSSRGNNIHEFAFDTDWNGATGNAINLDKVRIRNYGNDDRSVKFFQVEITTDGVNWEKLETPGSSAGAANFNFNLKFEGGSISTIDRQLNSTTWAADNIHDGDQNSRWLSSKGNNYITFEFDPDLDGTNARSDSDDRFTLQDIYLENYGVDDRSIFNFQIEVLQAGITEWRKLEVPGSTSGQPNFNFLLLHEGGNLASVDSQLNSSSWAGRNLHDGDLNSRWLSSKGNNTLTFDFDTDLDGQLSTQGDTNDRFRINSFYLLNYGNDDRSIKQFQVEVQSDTSVGWEKLKVPGSVPGQPSYEYLLSHNGGSISFVSSQLNTSTWAASNLNDGDQNSFWLSTNQQNTMEWVFDIDFDGNANDTINIDQIEIVNYGNNDRSVATFEVDVLIGGTWQPLLAPGSGTVFAAAMSTGTQTWSVASQSNVSGVRLRTLTNHGDSSYTGIAEFRVLGISQTPSYTFTASMNGLGETFQLDNEDRVEDTKAVRLITINNHGDRSYTGAAEFRALGESISASHTFEAAMTGAGELFALDTVDRPDNVTAVRLVTINNHGDRSYTGAAELEFRGPSLSASRVFSVPMSTGPHDISLDIDDRKTGVVGTRLITIRNHGDRSYTGLSEFGLLGDPVSPDYVFNLDAFSTAGVNTQSFEFSPRTASIARLHTLSNQGDRSYTGMASFELQGTTFPCGAQPPIAAYRILHDDRGLTCSAEQMTLQACADASCTALMDTATTVTLNALDWIGGNVVTFTGETTVNLRQTTPSTIALSLIDSAPVAPLTCQPDCDIEFTDAGLEFFNVNTNGSVLNTQIAESSLDAIGIRAIQDDNGQCSALIEGEQTVTLGFDCVSPASASYSSDICRVPFAGVPVQGAGQGVNSGDLSLTFDANGVASLSGLNYADAGKLNLSVSANIDGSNLSSGQTGLDVIPAELRISATNLGVPKTISGSEFTLNISAHGSLGSVLPSYQASQLQLGLTRLLPNTGGVDGTLYYSPTGSMSSQISPTFLDSVGLNFSNGTAGYTGAYYTEVGRVSLDARDTNYLDHTINSSGANLGDFRPAYFSVELVGTPQLENSHATFNYVGDNFGFNVGQQPQFSVTAKNALGDTTNNYSSELWQLSPSQASLQSETSYINQSGYPGDVGVITSGDTPTVSDHTNFDGEGSITITGAQLVFEKVDATSAPHGPTEPFEGRIDMQFSANFFTDSDGVCWQSSYPGSCEVFTIDTIGPNQQRYGRLRLVNTYGPETGPLNVPMVAEYFSGGQWRLNTDDNLTPVNYSVSSGHVAIQPIGTPDISGLVGSPSASGFLTSGATGVNDFKLTAPGSGNIGRLRLNLVPLVPGADWMEFMNFDWNGDGFIDDNDFPTAEAAFGWFRGNDRIFNRREVFE